MPNDKGVLSGSLSVYGGLDLSGELMGTASWAVSSSYSLTASYVNIVGNGITVNYSNSQIQLTGSGGGAAFPYVGDAQITGSLNVSGGITGSLSGSVSNIGDEYATPHCQTIVTLTALEYAAISPKDPNTLYFIV
jgi:hypothetical protein